MVSRAVSTVPTRFLQIVCISLAWHPQTARIWRQVGRMHKIMQKGAPETNMCGFLRQSPMKLRRRVCRLFAIHPPRNLTSGLSAISQPIPSPNSAMLTKCAATDFLSCLFLSDTTLQSEGEGGQRCAKERKLSFVEGCQRALLQ